MGQAKKRGTFEQRKEEALHLKENTFEAVTCSTTRDRKAKHFKWVTNHPQGRRSLKIYASRLVQE